MQARPCGEALHFSRFCTGFDAARARTPGTVEGHFILQVIIDAPVDGAPRLGASRDQFWGWCRPVSALQHRRPIRQSWRPDSSACRTSFCTAPSEARRRYAGTRGAHGHDLRAQPADRAPGAERRRRKSTGRGRLGGHGIENRVLCHGWVIAAPGVGDGRPPDTWDLLGHSAVERRGPEQTAKELSFVLGHVFRRHRSGSNACCVLSRLARSHCSCATT